MEFTGPKIPNDPVVIGAAKNHAGNVMYVQSLRPEVRYGEWGVKEDAMTEPEHPGYGKSRFYYRPVFVSDDEYNGFGTGIFLGWTKEEAEQTLEMLKAKAS